MRNIVLIILLFLNINPISANFLNDFGIGFGGSGSFPFESNNGGVVWLQSSDLVLDKNIGVNPSYTSIKGFNGKKFSELQSKLTNSKYVSFWLTKNWEENWFNINGIQKLIDNGKIPVFMYWYFGDNLNGIPSNDEKIQYYNNAIKFGKFLRKINGIKLVILEPEFNKLGILKDEKTKHNFASIISNAIDKIKTGNNNIFFSLAMMDTGARSLNETHCLNYINCSLGDEVEWNKSEIIYNDLLDKLDFISFQEMVGQFSRNPLSPGSWDNPNPIYYSNNEIGIDNLAKRIKNLTIFLHNKYNKPIFIPYMTVLTATWDDKNSDGKIEKVEINNNGWEEKASKVYKDLVQMKLKLKENGLFGFSVMELFDNPMHDNPGYQFFMENEYHIGIIKTSAIGGIDRYPNGDISFKGTIIDTLFGKESVIAPIKNNTITKKNSVIKKDNVIKNIKLDIETENILIKNIIISKFYLNKTLRGKRILSYINTYVDSIKKEDLINSYLDIERKEKKFPKYYNIIIYIKSKIGIRLYNENIVK